MNKGLKCCLVLLGIVLAASARAMPLSIVNVSSNVSCKFVTSTDCRVVVSDFVSNISVAGASGSGKLQSRTEPQGQPGTAGQGLYPYEYRVDLTQVGAVTHRVCVQEMKIDFGPIQPLDYNGDGRLDNVYVVTRGGLGSVAPSSADQTGGVITFHFQPAVCPGNRSGAGETSFFFGLASKQPPRQVNAQIGFTSGAASISVAAKVPEAPSAVARTVTRCLPNSPPSSVVIPADAPICACLRDPILRNETHCAFDLPGLVGIINLPLKVNPHDPFPIAWQVWPRIDAVLKASIKFEPPKGFRLLKGIQPNLQGGSAVGGANQVWLLASSRAGSYAATLRIHIPGTAKPLLVSLPLRVEKAQ